MRHRIRSVVVAVSVGLPASALVWPAPPATAVQPVECEVRDASGHCVGTNRGHGDGTGPVSTRGPLECEWHAFDDQAYGHSLFPPPENTLVDGGLIVYEDCGRPDGNGRYDPWERVGANGALAGFIGPAHIVRPVVWADPAEIARDLWARVVVGLPPPAPIVSPPLGEASIVDQPVFVAVANWPGVITPPEACDGPVCIQLSAVPTLVFTPGDGSDPIVCAGEGTRFDPSPGAPPPAVQAEGACAHVYPRRTTGEPWPGSVAIRWAVTWTSETPPDDGVIPVTPAGVPLPRQVDEVQGIVVDTGDGGA
jgi:hypothetical protein